MNHEDAKKLSEVLERIIPTSLDTLITRNRHRARLRLAEAADVKPLLKDIDPNQAVRNAVSGWHLIAHEVLLHDGWVRRLYLLGVNEEGDAWITSSVTGIDLANSRVTTHSGSTYRLVGDMRSGEPSVYLLRHVCAAFRQWGIGAALGMPPILF